MEKRKKICYYGNGDVYNGEWKNSKKNGKGIIVYKSGNKYDGYWEEGKKSGKGIYYFKNGDFFKGEWKNGKKNGKGVFYYKDKNLEEEGLRWYFEKGRYKVKRSYCIFLELDFLISLRYMVFKN